MNKKYKSSYKTVFVDIDETLIHHKTGLVTWQLAHVYCVSYINGDVWFMKNLKNIKLVEHFYALGYDVLVWSKTGADWAELVCKKIEIDKYVKCYLSKPTFYIDDKDVSEWIGPREWKAPI